MLTPELDRALARISPPPGFRSRDIPTRLRLGRKSRAELFAGHRMIDSVTTDILAAGLND